MKQQITNNKNKFKVGDRVRISRDSKYYDSGITSNPTDHDGTVTRYDAYAVEVEWDNGTTNDYKDNDLELVTVNEAIRMQQLAGILKEDNTKC